jgi:Uncharacterized conserved protein (DUF2190)
MPDAVFKHAGSGITPYAYKPGTAVVEGQVVVLGGVTNITCGIAPRAIAANEDSVLYLGGVWEVINLDNAINQTKVYWDNAAKKATTTATANALLGFIVGGGGGGANSKCLVEHNPYV